jgi:hypothetical protein
MSCMHWIDLNRTTTGNFMKKSPYTGLERVKMKTPLFMLFWLLHFYLSCKIDLVKILISTCHSIS